MAEKTLEELTDEELAELSQDERDALLESGEAEHEAIKAEETPPADQLTPPGPVTDEELAQVAQRVDNIENLPAYKQERYKRQQAQQELEQRDIELADLRTEIEQLRDDIVADREGDDDKVDFDEMSAEDVVKEIEKRVDKKIEALEETEDHTGENRYQLVEPDDLASPQVMDLHGNDMGEYVTIRPGRTFELMNDQDTGETFPVFDFTALQEVDRATLAMVGPKVFQEMWGSANQPGPLAVWRRNRFDEFLMALDTNSPPKAFLDKYQQIRKHMASIQQQQPPGSAPPPQPRPTQPPTTEEPPPGLGPGVTGGGGGQPGARNLKRVEEYTDTELTALSQEERDKLLY